MAHFEIPVPINFRNFRFVIDMDGEEFQMDVKWNIRDEAFYLNFYDVSGQAIVLGKRMTANELLLNHIRSEDRPLGEVIVFDEGEVPSQPAPGTLGVEHKLIYIDANGVLFALLDSVN